MEQIDRVGTTDQGRVHVLRDGGRVLIRPLRPTDRDALAAGYERLSELSRRLRFGFAPNHPSPRFLDRLLDVDGDDRFAWAAFMIDEPGQPGVGIARYTRRRDQPGAAEAAVAVVDDHQRRGIGALLLRELAAQASSKGIKALIATVSWENRDLLDGLRTFGATITPDEPGVASVRVELESPDG